MAIKTTTKTVDKDAEEKPKKQPRAKKVVKKPEMPEVIGQYDIVGQDDVKKIVRVGVKENYPVLLVGDTGCGKTSIVKNIADEHDKEWVRFNLTGDTTVDEFVGKYVLKNEETVWEDGILLQAMKQGKWLIVDEINVALPEILFVLHSLLDDDKFIVAAQKDGEIVRPHDNFRFFATMNPVDEYAGTKDLNKAFKSRFNIVVNMAYPDHAIETEVVHQKSGVDKEIAIQIVDVGRKIREAKSKSEIFFTCSTRDLIQWGNLVDKLDMETGFTMAILNKADSDADRLVHIYGDIIGKYKKLKKEADYKLNIDWFAEEWKKMNKAKRNLKKREDDIRAEVREEMLELLSKGTGGTGKLELVEGEIVGKDGKVVNVKMEEIDF